MKSYSHFFSKKFQRFCVSLDVNFNESLTNNVVSFEQLGPALWVKFSADDKIFFLFFFLISLENRIWHFVQIVSICINVKSCFLGKIRKILIYHLLKLPREKKRLVRTSDMWYFHFFLLKVNNWHLIPIISKGVGLIDWQTLISRRKKIGVLTFTTLS